MYSTTFCFEVFPHSPSSASRFASSHMISAQVVAILGMTQVRRSSRYGSNPTHGNTQDTEHPIRKTEDAKLSEPVQSSLSGCHFFVLCEFYLLLTCSVCHFYNTAHAILNRYPLPTRCLRLDLHRAFFQHHLDRVRVRGGGFSLGFFASWSSNSGRRPLGFSESRWNFDTYVAPFRVSMGFTAGLLAMAVPVVLKKCYMSCFQISHLASDEAAAALHNTHTAGEPLVPLPPCLACLT